MIPDNTARPGRAARGAGAGIVGLSPETQVMTADGALPAAFLNAGDRIVTRRGMRRLAAVHHAQVAPGTRRVLVRADALGGKPEVDTLLMPAQRLLVRDWRAKALWNRSVAAPTVARLVDGSFVQWVTAQDAAPILSLYFGAPEVIYADGLELASADPWPAKAPAGASSAART